MFLNKYQKIFFFVSPLIPYTDVSGGKEKTTTNCTEERGQFKTAEIHFLGYDFFKMHLAARTVCKKTKGLCVPRRSKARTCE